MRCRDCPSWRSSVWVRDGGLRRIESACVRNASADADGSGVPIEVCPNGMCPFEDHGDLDPELAVSRLSWVCERMLKDYMRCAMERYVLMHPDKAGVNGSVIERLKGTREGSRIGKYMDVLRRIGVDV